MFDWLRSLPRRLGRATTQNIALISNWLANQLWLIESKFLALAQQGYSQNEVVYACVRLLSQSVPEPPLVAYRKNGKEKQPLDETDELVQLIRRPNELMTEYEMWELTTIQMAIVGRSVWWKERNNLGLPIALWPLRPDRVGPIYSIGAKAGERVISGYVYQTPGTGQAVPIPRRDCLAFNFPDVVGESGGIVEGLGPVQALARMIAADNEATKFVGALLANYAAPTVALKLKAAIRNEAEAVMIKAKFRHEFGGANRGTPALLDAETEIEAIGFNLRELEFPDVRENAEARIAAALGVPAVLAGLRVGLKEQNQRATVKELRQLFAETTLANYWRRYQEQFTLDVATDFGEDIICEFDTSQVKALAGQFIEQLLPIKEAFEKGVVTRNEYRLALKMEAVEPAIGDVFLVANNVSEVAANEQVRVVIQKRDQEKMAEQQKLMAAQQPKLLGPGKEKPEREDEETEKKSYAFKAVDPREEAEKALQRALQGLFADMAGQIAERIERGELPTNDELSLAFGTVLEPKLVEAATNEGIRLAAEVGVQFDPAVVNQAAVEWARTYQYDLVRGLTETTQKVIRSAFEKYAMTPGMTIGELQGLLEPAFGAVRAEAISVTEITRAASEATNYYQQELSDMGIKMERVWRTANDEIVRQCPICWPKNNKPESVWVSEFPNGPPGHVRCRCSTTLRVVREKASVT